LVVHGRLFLADCGDDLIMGDDFGWLSRSARRSVSLGSLAPSSLSRSPLSL
jgi:hypothetical protein